MNAIAGGAQQRLVLAVFRCEQFFGMLARFKQGAESIGHFVEAVAHLPEFIARVEIDARAHVAAGKGACRTGQRLDAADRGVVAANREIDHHHEQQEGDADTGAQRIFRPGNTCIDLGFDGRQQRSIYVRITVVDHRGDHHQEIFRGSGELAGKNVFFQKDDKLHYRIGNIP